MQNEKELVTIPITYTKKADGNFVVHLPQNLEGVGVQEPIMEYVVPNSDVETQRVFKVLEAHIAADKNKLFTLINAFLQEDVKLFFNKHSELIEYVFKNNNGVESLNYLLVLKDNHLNNRAIFNRYLQKHGASELADFVTLYFHLIDCQTFEQLENVERFYEKIPLTEKVVK